MMFTLKKTNERLDRLFLRIGEIKETQDRILSLLSQKETEDKLRDYRDPVSGLFKRK